MNQQHTDLTFFTNDGTQTLLSRFKATLADTLDSVDVVRTIREALKR